ncbi:MAG: 2Fe-2S iron-sulfur cluster-binding protein [Ilumatobacteraceae bacterium]
MKSGTPMISFILNNQAVTVPAEGTLLTALRESLRTTPHHVTSVKDGCAPQGQCGCCTVWVDGEPRVACVTPVTRVRDRSVTTLEGLDEEIRETWSEALCATGGSQCGFCTPGIIMRLAPKVAMHPRLEGRHDDLRDTVNTALLAHLCRCTGWQTIHEAAVIVASGRRERDGHDDRRGDIHGGRNLDLASQRATIEGRASQKVDPQVALGEGGFADDRAPDDALVAVLSPEGNWVVGETPAAARQVAGVVPGRKSTVPVSWPVGVARDHGDDGPRDHGFRDHSFHDHDFHDHGFTLTLQTTWVEPGYLEPDAVWCVPGGEPVGPLVNGGSFGGKNFGKLGGKNSGDIDPKKSDRGDNDQYLDLGAVARRLADEHGRPMRVILSREDVVRHGPKRPPMALGVRADGSGELWAVSTPGLPELMKSYAPDWVLHEIEGSETGTGSSITTSKGSGARSLSTSLALRAAGWAEIAVMRSAVRGSRDLSISDQVYTDYVISPEGAQAWASVSDDVVRVRVKCGPVLDPVVLRSYCIGAAHMALGWVRCEGIAVNDSGEAVDLTIRSFGILRAVDMPEIEVEIVEHDPPVQGSVTSVSVIHDPVNGSDAVFAAVAAAAWRHAGFPPAWPCSRGS